MKRKLVIAAAGLCLAAAVVAALAMAGLFAKGEPQEGDKVYTAGGHWAEDLGEANLESAARFAEKLKTLKTDLLTDGNRAFYAIVPDKGFYLPGETATDYQTLFAAADEGLAGSGIEKIDLTGALSLEDYYFTDSHWRQERLDGVVDALGAALGFSADLSAFDPPGRHRPGAGDLPGLLRQQPCAPFAGALPHHHPGGHPVYGQRPGAPVCGVHRPGRAVLVQHLCGGPKRHAAVIPPVRFVQFGVSSPGKRGQNAELFLPGLAIPRPLCNTGDMQKTGGVLHERVHTSYDPFQRRA